METGKTEIQSKAADLKIRKKARFKKLTIWLLVDIAVAGIVFALLLHKPGRYTPVESGSYNPEQVSKYLTHELSPKIYNGAQLGKPFDVVVTQDGMNEIVAGLGWPKASEDVMLYAPAVLFVPGSVVLMGTADIKGVEFIITIELEAMMDEQRLLRLQATKVKIGAINITPLAKMLAKKMYAEQIAATEIDREALGTKIAGALLNDEPIEPVFKLEDAKVRVEKIAVQEEKLILHLVPVS